jgi:hypothetical protein
MYQGASGVKLAIATNPSKEMQWQRVCIESAAGLSDTAA